MPVDLHFGRKQKAQRVIKYAVPSKSTPSVQEKKLFVLQGTMSARPQTILR